jgi:hypothetical protein
LEGAALGDDEVCEEFDLLQDVNTRSVERRRRFFIQIEL